MYALIVARGYPSEKYKMNGIFEFDQAKALAKEGHKIIYAAVDIRSIRRWRKWGIEKREIDGVKLFIMNIPGGRIPRRALQQLSIIGFHILYKLIVKLHDTPDIIHSHFIEPSYAVAKFIRDKNIPFVITEHSSVMMFPQLDSKVYEAALYSYNKADAVISVSEALKKQLKNKFNIESVNIPNILNTDIFECKPRSSHIDAEFRVISVGGLIPIKRMDITIRAFAEAFKNIENATLRIFGEGPERQKLEKIIQSYNMTDRIKLMGLCSREEVAYYMNLSDLFVLASEVETFGVAYIEALSSGLPVIATRCGGPEGFVNEENGIIINIDDKDEFVIALKSIYKNINRYNKNDISKKISSKFSEKVVLKELITLYEGIIEKRRIIK